MREVDQHDWYLENHSISIRGKNGIRPSLQAMIDMSVVNAYLLYKIIQENNKKILIKEFRREIAI